MGMGSEGWDQNKANLAVIDDWVKFVRWVYMSLLSRIFEHVCNEMFKNVEITNKEEKSVRCWGRGVGLAHLGGQCVEPALPSLSSRDNRKVLDLGETTKRDIKRTHHCAQHMRETQMYLRIESIKDKVGTDILRDFDFIHWEDIAGFWETFKYFISCLRAVFLSVKWKIWI